MASASWSEHGRIEMDRGRVNFDEERAIRMGSPLVSGNVQHLYFRVLFNVTCRRRTMLITMTKTVNNDETDCDNERKAKSKCGCLCDVPWQKQRIEAMSAGGHSSEAREQATVYDLIKEKCRQGQIRYLISSQQG